MPLIEIKTFKGLIDNKPFFNQKVKNKQEAYENFVEMPKSDYYQTAKLLDYFHHWNNYKLIGTDLSRQINTGISHQISFVGKLEEYGGTTILFIAWKQENKLFKTFL